MKKKISSIILIVVSVLFMSMSIVGCNKKQEENKEEEIMVQDVQLCDFESWVPNFNNILLYNDFGRVSLNRDKKYISQGEGSARIDPLGGKNSLGYPYVVFTTKSSSYDYSDFSYADYISFDIYNDNNVEKSIYAGIIDKIGSITTATRINEKEIKLKAGWNNCKLQIEKDLLALFSNVKDIQGFYLRFEPSFSANVNDNTPKYYVDNIKIVNSQIKTEENLPIKLDENEIADFETLYQQFMFNSDTNIDFKIVKAVDKGIVAPSGNNVLQTTLPGNGKNNGDWNYFTISPTLLKASDFYKLDNDKEKAKNAYFCFEVYNDSDQVINSSVLYKTSGNESIADTFLQNKAKQWATYEYSIGELLMRDPNYLTKIGDIRIFYKAQYEGNKIFYFDNFRIEIR